MKPEEIHLALQVLSLLFSLLSLAFGLGGAWFLVRQNRRDLRGIGGKVSAEIARASSRHQKVILALMSVATDDQKARVAGILNEPLEELRR
jgi:hypothetical protein